MNADPSRAGAGGEDNSWETLAEDLFGIDLGADPSREPLVVPEDLALDEPESSAAEVKPALEKSAPAPSAGKHDSASASPEKRTSHEEKRPQRRHAPPGRPPMRDKDDFGADLDLDEPQSPDADFEGELEIEEEIISAEEVSNQEEAGDSAADESPALGGEKSDSSEEDPYWDTLKTWQWSEEEGESGEHSENRGRPGQRGGRGGGGPRRPGGRERSGGRERRPPQGGSRPPRSEGRTEARGEKRRDERPPSRRAEGPPDRSRRQPPPPPPPRSESEEIDDFGAGLIEEQPFAEPARGGGEPWHADSQAEGRHAREEFVEPDEAHEVEEGAESVEQTDAERPPRRRRRRRRSRSRKERPGEPMERQEPAEPKDEAEFEEPSADELVSEEENAEETGVEAEERGTEAPRRRRRRRRRPGDRGPRPAPLVEQPLTEAEADEEFPAESRLDASSADEDDDEEEVETEVDAEADDEAPRVYRNVPTWEEAISFLLHRRPGDSRPREGESGAPREFRREGGRRPPDRGERSHD